LLATLSEGLPTTTKKKIDRDSGTLKRGGGSSREKHKRNESECQEETKIGVDKVDRGIGRFGGDKVKNKWLRKGW
jgi:hypothetical protein